MHFENEMWFSDFNNCSGYIIGVLAGISIGIMFCGVYIGRLTSSARERKAL